VSCNPPNVRCGGRCIPPSWDCRLKGEGPDPHLRAVKTDPLSGFANIQRGVQRITKGVTRGNFSEVEGGKRAIIRGVVKTVPGDIQQKKQLKTTLENRTRAIGIGLAVVTTGLGMHAILMKSNLYGYNKGWGKDINQATRAGVSRVLDSIPVLGAQRRATRAAVGANLGAAAARASAPAMSTSAIPGTTVLSATDRESHSALQQSLNKINGATRSGAAGTSGNLENWNQKHNTAFWSATRKSDITGVGAPARVSIYAEPTAQEYLGKQFGVPPGERSSRSGVKAALQARFDEERRGLVSLAKQQGLRVRSGPNGDTIDSKDINAFVSGVMRSRPIADTAARQSVEAHVRSVLTKAPSSYTNEVYNASVLSFDSFYKATSRDIRTIPGVAATTGRRIATPLSTGSNELLRNTNTYRSTYLAGEMRARTQMAGPAHSELVQAAYYHTKVAGTNASSYTIPDRLAFNAASELSGRPVTSRSEAIGIINRETGFSGARVATTAAAPRTAAPRTTGQARPATRRLRSRSELISRLTKGGLSAEAAAAEADRIISRRGDSADLPPRVAAYLELRNDFVAGKKGLGKPCGESHIPKAHECRKGRGAQAAPQSGITADRLKAAATGALVAGLAVGGTAAFRNRQTLAMGSIRALSGDGIKQGLAKVPARFREPVRNLVGRTKTAVAGVLMVSKGSKLIDVDNLNNMATFSLRNGDLVSVSNVGDTLVMFRTHPHNTIDYGGGQTAGRYVVDFTVDLSHKQTKQDRKQALGIARKTKTMFGKQMSYVPDNSFVTAEALGTDGLGNKRGGIYQKYGFQPIGDISTHLWGIKSKGEFRKMNQRQTSSLVSVLREQKRVDSAKLANRSDFVAGKKGLGKPCGESHIPKAHECRKGRGAQAAPASSESKNNTKTVAAAALLGTAAVATGLYVVHDLKRVEKQTNMFKASPSIKTTIKQAKVDFDTKKSGTAMGNYYTQKSGLKPGDVVYYRTEKDPAAHFGVYLGEGADGKVRAVMANTNEKRAGFIDIFEVGTTKPNSNDAAHFMLPVLQKAPTLGGNARLSNEETVRRALRSVGSDYKFSLTRDNCEVLANSIAYGTPRSQQLERFTRVTRAVADSTIGVQQRTVGTIRRARGQTVTKALTAKQIMARLERDDSTFLTTEGKTVAGAHYKQFFADGTRFDARYDALGELLTPAQVWSKIKDYDNLQKAIAMRDYLLLVRLASEAEKPSAA
jgi:hypothetical protein